MAEKRPDEREREELTNLREEVKTKSEERTEEQKEIFHWRILDMRIRKWYLNKKENKHADKLSKRKVVWRVAYTNINSIISSLRDLNVYFVKKAPDIMGLTEIKLYEELEEVKNIRQNMYNIWKRSRSNKKVEE